jgi:hypothetical protein
MAGEDLFAPNIAQVNKTPEDYEKTVVTAVKPETDERFRKSNQPHTESLGLVLREECLALGLTPETR